MLRISLASNLRWKSAPEGTMTQLKKLIAPTALLALTVAAAPAFAQEKYHGRENKSGESRGEKAQPRGESRPQGGAAPRVESRQETPRAQQPAPQPQQAAPQPAPQAQRRQGEQSRAPRAESRSNNENRSNNEYRSNNDRQNNRGYQGQAVPRAYAPHYEPHYAPHYAPRGYGYYGSRSYYRPYVFRPRFTIGFGIYAGYPVPYTYSYPYPITVYGYRAPRASVMVGPGSPYYGGVALEMTPYDADVFVDGEYAGHVEDFDGTTQPLTLTAGMHEIEVQAQGFEPMRINVEIQPGQVIPYRGDLRPY